MAKLEACILGATGAAGQNVVEALRSHPWFQASCLAASSRSAGKAYQEAIEGAVFFRRMPDEEILEARVDEMGELRPSDFDLAFSALPSEVARRAEPRFAEEIPVISTASAFRYEEDIPILIPEVNPDHVRLLEVQRARRGWGGFICPGPNCTTAGLVITLKPLREAFGVREVHMVSMQALSGAGEIGLRADSEYRRSVEMNVLPYIEREEEKVRAETLKVLGAYADGRLADAELRISCSCNRVYVENVHTEAVFAGLGRSAALEEVKEALRRFTAEPQRLRLPSAPEMPIVVLEEADMPQPLAHERYGGMVTLVGRVRRDEVFENGVAYTLTSDNTGRGAGGGAVLTAEYLRVKGYL